MGTPTGTETAVDGDRRKNEAKLVAAAMGGDAEAVSTLWRQHRRWIAAVLLSHKPVFEDLDDLLQEVAMTLVAKIHTLREETNVRAWLRTVAINAARAAGRSGRYRPRPESSIAPTGLRETAGDPEDPDAGEQVTELLQRLEQLPEGYREPLLLRVSKGLRSKQIADILGVPPATIDTRIARARRMLREAACADVSAPLQFDPNVAVVRRADEAI